MNTLKDLFTRGDSKIGEYIITVENLPVWDFKQVKENTLELIHSEEDLPQEEYVTLIELKTILIESVIPFSKIQLRSEEFSSNLVKYSIFENSKKINLTI